MCPDRSNPPPRRSAAPLVWSNAGWRLVTLWAFGLALLSTWVIASRGSSDSALGLVARNAARSGFQAFVPGDGNLDPASSWSMSPIERHHRRHELLRTRLENAEKDSPEWEDLMLLTSLDLYAWGRFDEEQTVKSVRCSMALDTHDGARPRARRVRETIDGLVGVTHTSCWGRAGVRVRSTN